MKFVDRLPFTVPTKISSGFHAQGVSFLKKIIANLGSGALDLVAWMNEHESLHPDQRPSNWAQPIQADGVKNLYRVSSHLYRGEQPSKRGMRSLEHLGVRTIINLRSFHCNLDKLHGTNIKNHRVKMNTWRIRYRDAAILLKILSRTEDGPFLIHCQHGADRTGVMIATYRMVVEGWSKEEALRELMLGGFGFHSMWRNIVRYIERFDVDLMKQALAKLDDHDHRVS